MRANDHIAMLVKHIVSAVIRFYQLIISPVIGGYSQCRFSPSCSDYAALAIQEHGIIHGSFMALRRICRCRPGGGCGHDPVPPAPHSIHTH